MLTRLVVNWGYAMYSKAACEKQQAACALRPS
jgi:hypothetical protein